MLPDTIFKLFNLVGNPSVGCTDTRLRMRRACGAYYLFFAINRMGAFGVSTSGFGGTEARRGGLRYKKTRYVHENGIQ